MDEASNLAPKPEEIANPAPVPDQTPGANPAEIADALQSGESAIATVQAAALRPEVAALVAPDPGNPNPGAPPGGSQSGGSAASAPQGGGAKKGQILLGLFIIAMVALNLLVLIVLPIVFHKNLIEAAFYGYLTVAASTALVLLIVAFLPYELTDYLFWVRTQTEATGFWGRLKWVWHFALLSPIVNGLNWPGFLVVVIIAQSRVRKNQRGGGRQREMATYVRAFCEPVYAIVSLLEIGFCYAMVDLQRSAVVAVEHRQLEYARALVAVFCIGILVRLVQYLQVEGGLLAGLRSVPGIPAVRFVIILAANYVALVLGVSASTTWVTQQIHVPSETIRKIAISLTSLVDVKNRIVPGALTLKAHALKAMSLNDWLLTVATLLFYFVVLKSVIRLRDFARTDEDYAALSHILTTRGQYKEALQQLQKIKNMSANYESMKIAPNLGQGNIDRAYALTERWLEGKQEKAAVSAEDVYTVLFLTGFTNYSLPIPVMINLFREAQKNKCQDAALAAAIMGAALLGQLSTAECRDAFPPGTEADYPLTHAAIFVAEGSKADALDMFRRSVSTTPADQVMKLTYVFLYELSPQVEAGADPGALAQAWLTANFDHYRALCDACTEDWNEELTLGLVSPMCSLPPLLSPLPERFQQLRDEIDDRISSRPGGVERKTFLKAVLVGAERHFQA